MTKSTTTHVGGMRCHSFWPVSGADFRTDVPKELGGIGKYPPPASLLAATVASCMLSMIAYTGERKGFSTRDVRIESSCEEGAQGITALCFRIIVPVVTTPVVRRLMENAALHCPVGAVIDPRVEKRISWEWAE